MRLETRIVLLGVRKAERKQDRADKRQQRQRNFRNHQQAEQAIVRPAQPSASSAGLQNLVDVRAGSLDGGDDPEDQAGQQGDKQRESQDAGIEGKIDGTVEKKRRSEGPQQIASPVGHEQTSPSPEQREHGAFRPKLPAPAERAPPHP